MSEFGGNQGVDKESRLVEEARFTSALHEYHLAHYKLLKEHLKENPSFDKSGALLYHASGADIATFLGSGLSTAYYIDIGYSEKKEDSPLEELKKEVNRVDEHFLFVRTNIDSGEAKGRITFNFQGESKTIIFEGRDATGYVPPEIGKVSLFASIGCSPALEKPPIEADAYYTSTVIPRALGFSDCHFSENSGALSFKYSNPKFSHEEQEIMENISLLSGYFNTLRENLLTGNLEGLSGHKKLFIRAVKEYKGNPFLVFEPLDSFYVRDFKRRFKELTLVRPEITDLLKQDLVGFFAPAAVVENLEARKIGKKLVQYFETL